MRTFQLHILAADRVFFEGECESVVAPTASGNMACRRTTAT